MDTEQQPEESAPRSSRPDTRPVVLALVGDSVGSLALLLLAAEIAVARRARLHVAHVKPSRIWWSGVGGGLMLPPHLVREAERLAANQLRGKIASLLALTPSVDWTMTWTMGSVRYNVACLVSELSPIAVVVGAPRRRQFRVRQSLASWLVGRSNVLAVVAPA